MMNQFTAIFTDEAQENITNLEKSQQDRIIRAIKLFEQFGQKACNSRQLSKDGLFEIKADKVRAYFIYYENQLIIIGLVVLKKTQKAPERYKMQATSIIKKFINKCKEQ